jgi:hypothetical protein
VSPTPIYDELREARPAERTVDLVAVQATVRLVVPLCEAGNVSDLHSRRGVGGRHRRSA